jgi:multiple sugar transport system permease protein/raffinose/stachyose/melibiose transport system permease protein
MTGRTAVLTWTARRGRERRRRRLLPYALVAPAVGLVGLITVYPSLYVAYTALTDWSLQRASVGFVGLGNFGILVRDPLFWRVLLNTLAFLVGSLTGAVGLGLVLALLLSRRLPGRAVFRSVAIVPFTISAVVVGVMWRWIVDPDLGIGNYTIALATGVWVPFLLNEQLALGLLVLVEVWRTAGYAMVLLLAGLQGIDPGLYEAAAIDGADARRRLRHITLPLLVPTILVTMVLLSIYAVNLVDLILVITGGGPARLTETIGVYMWKESFVFFNIGYGAAVAIVMFALNLTLTLLYFAVFRRD